MLELFVYWFLVFFMLLGVVGAMVPTLPGASLILLCVVVWGAMAGFQSVAVPLSVAVVVLLLSVAIDILASVWGAKRAGASNWGQLGAIVGLVLGIFGLLPALPVGGPLLGVVFGPLLGAIVGEFLYRHSFAPWPRLKQACKAGVGIVVGTAIGNLIQGLLALAALVAFLVGTWGQWAIA